MWAIREIVVKGSKISDEPKGISSRAVLYNIITIVITIYCILGKKTLNLEKSKTVSPWPEREG